MIVVVGSAIVGLVAIGTSTTTTPTRVVSIVATATCATAIAIVAFLIEGHSTILFIGPVRLVWIHEIHQHVVGFANRLGVLVNSSDEIVLSSRDQRPISFAIRMCEEHHCKIFLANGQNHARSNGCIGWVIVVLNNAFGNVGLVGPQISV